MRQTKTLIPTASGLILARGLQAFNELLHRHKPKGSGCIPKSSEWLGEGRRKAMHMEVLDGMKRWSVKTQPRSDPHLVVCRQIWTGARVPAEAAPGVLPQELCADDSHVPYEGQVGWSQACDGRNVPLGYNQKVFLRPRVLGGKCHDLRRTAQNKKLGDRQWPATRSGSRATGRREARHLLVDEQEVPSLPTTRNVAEHAARLVTGWP